MLCRLSACYILACIVTALLPVIHLLSTLPRSRNSWNGLRLAMWIYVIYSGKRSTLTKDLEHGRRV